MTDEDSFRNVERWMSEAQQFGAPEVSLMLVGTKSDLMGKRVVDHGTAQAFADNNGMPFFETSAKTNQNVEQAFLALTANIKNQKALDQMASDLHDDVIRIQVEKTEE